MWNSLLMFGSFYYVFEHTCAHTNAHNIAVMLKTGYCAAADEEADTLHVESQRRGVRGEGWENIMPRVTDEVVLLICHSQAAVSPQPTDTHI